MRVSSLSAEGPSVSWGGRVPGPAPAVPDLAPLALFQKESRLPSLLSGACARIARPRRACALGVFSPAPSPTQQLLRPRCLCLGACPILLLGLNPKPAGTGCEQSGDGPGVKLTAAGVLLPVPVAPRRGAGLLGTGLPRGARRRSRPLWQSPVLCSAAAVAVWYQRCEDTLASGGPLLLGRAFCFFLPFFSFPFVSLSLLLLDFKLL